MTKFHEDWTKDVDFLLKASFLMWALFFDPDFRKESEILEHPRFVFNVQMKVQKTSIKLTLAKKVGKGHAKSSFI